MWVQIYTKISIFYIFDIWTKPIYYLYKSGNLFKSSEKFSQLGMWFHLDKIIQIVPLGFVLIFQEKKRFQKVLILPKTSPLSFHIRTFQDRSSIACGCHLKQLRQVKHLSNLVLIWSVSFLLLSCLSFALLPTPFFFSSVLNWVPQMHRVFQGPVVKLCMFSNLYLLSSGNLWKCTWQIFRASCLSTPHWTDNKIIISESKLL